MSNSAGMIHSWRRWGGVHVGVTATTAEERHHGHPRKGATQHDADLEHFRHEPLAVLARVHGRLGEQDFALRGVDLELLPGVLPDDFHVVPATHNPVVHRVVDLLGRVTIRVAINNTTPSQRRRRREEPRPPWIAGV